MCGKTYESYKTTKGVESTRCPKCQTTMKEQDKRRTHRQRNYKNENYRNIQRYQKAYELSAKRRNYAFELSALQFEHLVKAPCFYCGQKTEGEANGIDRLDNNKGYTLENSRSCCEMCNHMKYMYATEYFLNKASHIANGTQPDDSFHTTWGYSQSLCTTKYKYYATECASRHISFLLSEDQWNELTNGACYICGFHDTPVGIDRYDNSVRSYSYENCRPCCRPCNVMKFTYSYEELKEQCKDLRQMAGSQCV
jgi:hypothetical protein